MLKLDDRARNHNKHTIGSDQPMNLGFIGHEPITLFKSSDNTKDDHNLILGIVRVFEGAAFVLNKISKF